MTPTDTEIGENRMRLIIIAVAVALSACTSENKTKETLDNIGFKNVETKGYAFFACGEDYLYHTKFRAQNPNGKWVEGVACCGILKGCTVKF